jgi:hypothetical protein
MRVTRWIRAAAGRNRRSKPDSGGHSNRPARWNGESTPKPCQEDHRQAVCGKPRTRN